MDQREIVANHIQTSDYEKYEICSIEAYRNNLEPVKSYYS